MKIGLSDPYAVVKVILVVSSLALNVFGNTWGAPASWHPDEIIARTIRMVRTSDPNPHYFTYGGLHHYVLAGLAVTPATIGGRLASAAGLIDETSGPSVDQTTLKWTMVAARTISALMTAGLVAITIEIGARLFSPAAGLAAGLLLLLAPGSVVIGHFAAVDAAANFWYWLACLATLGIWKTGSRRAYFLSGIVAGLAIGTKIDRSLVMVPLVVAHLLRGRAGRHRDLLAAFGLAALAFLASNPFVVMAPFEFLDGFTLHFMFNALRPKANHPVREFALYVQWGLGTPLLILMATGVGIGSFLLLREGRYRELVWLAATSTPIVVLYSLTASMDRYATLLFPGLALLAGFSVARVLSQGPAWRRALIGAPIAAALGWSLIACLAVDRVLAGDPRYAAAEWLDRNASVGSRVAMDRYGPWLDRTRYRVALLEQDSAMQEDDYRTRVRLRECGSCERIRSAIFEAERRIGWALGRSSDRKRYTTWFDSLVERIDSERIRPPDLLDADYVLLLPHRKPVTMKRLAAPGSGYELVANFPAPRPFGMRPPFSFIGRPVEIYARKAP